MDAFNDFVFKNESVWCTRDIVSQMQQVIHKVI